MLSLVLTKPEKRSLEPSIVIDTREYTSAPEIYERLSKRFLVTKEVLDSGDYWYPATGIAVERKTESDFWNSLCSRRLWNQLEELTKLYEKPLLLLEKEGWEIEKSLPAIVSILFSWKKLKVMVTRSREETIRFLGQVATYSGPSGRVPVPKVVKKEESVFETRKNMLMCVKGLSIKRSLKLLSKYKNFEELIKEGEKILEFKSIPRNSLKRLREVLSGE